MANSVFPDRLTVMQEEENVVPFDQQPTAVIRLPWWGSLVLFGVPTILMWMATRWGIPRITEMQLGPSILSWFIAGGGVFVSLFVAALVGFWWERRAVTLEGFNDRFRLRRVRWMDGLTVVVALIACAMASGVIHFVWTTLATTTGLVDVPELSPPFVQMEPLTSETLWVLAAWLPMFFFNIAGEELWWRGYILPREEKEHGRWAWLFHAAGLMLFHLPLGIDLTLLLIPFLMAIPWLVQRSQNTWVGFIFHGLLNGIGFLAVAAGLA